MYVGMHLHTKVLGEDPGGVASRPLPEQKIPGSNSVFRYIYIAVLLSKKT
jgi:hypothetical protein